MSVRVLRTRLSRLVCPRVCLFPHRIWLPVSRLAMRLWLVGLVAGGSITACSGAWAQTMTSGAATGSDRMSDLPLVTLVERYLATTDRMQAEPLLQAILAHAGASLDRVSHLLRSYRPYGPAAVGMLPGQPVQVRGKTLSYGLFVPRAHDADVALPLVVCLHGAGFTGDAYLERWASRLGDNVILACPTFTMGAWWTRIAEDLVLATINDVRATYRIDPDRIYLTGMSNGGIGAWIIGMHHAPLFAAVAPMAGGIDDVLFPFLANLRQTPVYVIHGSQDAIMPVHLSRAITSELTRLGIAHTYREHDRSHPHAGGHFFPRQELPALLKWLGKQRRHPYPQRVTVVRDASHLEAFGWVRIDATDRIAMFSERMVDHVDALIQNRVYASLDATITRPNHIDVQVTRVRRYTLLLNESLVDFSQPLTVVTNGRTTFDGQVSPHVEVLLREARRRGNADRLFPARLTMDVPS